MSLPLVITEDRAKSVSEKRVARAHACAEAYPAAGGGGRGQAAGAQRHTNAAKRLASQAQQEKDQPRD